MKKLSLGLSVLPLVFTALLATSNPASASSPVVGLTPCVAGPSCHYGPVHASYPNYDSVCFDENCAYVAAANVIQITTGRKVSATTLRFAFIQTGQRFRAGTSLTSLWRAWPTLGIDGDFLASKGSNASDERHLEKEIVSHEALLATIHLASGATFGVAHYAPGLHDVVVDGFTPEGPLAVYQGRTVQATWSQWAGDVRGVWSVKTSLVDAAAIPTPAPPAALLVLSDADVPASGATVVLNYFSTAAASCTLTSSPSLWVGDVSDPSCNDSYALVVPASTSPNEWTLTFSVVLASGATATSTQTLTQGAPPTPPAPTDTNTSTNWSGYVVPSGSTIITSVEGYFTVPTLTCPDSTVGAVGTWVGIGGVPLSATTTSGSLLQTGVNSLCVGSLQLNLGFFELFPTNPNLSYSFDDLPIAAGDVMQASVYQIPSGQWVTLLSDLSDGLSGVMVTGGSYGTGPTNLIGDGGWYVQGSTAKMTYDGGTTAEWIVEDITDGLTGDLEPFANYGAVTWTGLESSVPYGALPPSDAVVLVQSGVALATPTSPSGDGFTDVYTGP